MHTTPTKTRPCWKLSVFSALLATATGLSCSREDVPPERPTPTPVRPGPVVFPPQTQADDPAVNDFVLRATQTCAEGDYAAFRLLWSAREEPLAESVLRYVNRLSDLLFVLARLENARAGVADVAWVGRNR